MSEKTWTVRKVLFERMKRASSKHRAAKREAIKARWYSWVDRFVWVK